MHLSKQQRTIVEHPGGPLLVLACPGSGKTRCITERIIHLLDSGVKSNSILAVTFTNKAANEMRERVEQKGYEGILMCTFHSFCVKILRKCGKLLGYKQNFTIYDDPKSLIRKITRSQGHDPEGPFDTLRIMGMIEDKKNQLLTDEQFELHLDEDIIKIIREYQRTLKMSNSMDFGDLIYNTVKLFDKYSQVRDLISSRYKHILVDEMQDTNKAQLELVKHLSKHHNNVIVVGDSDQSIYGWRGADINNILAFEEHFKGASVAQLGSNYRCTPQILKAAESLISNNSQRRDIELDAVRDIGSDVNYDEYKSPEEEAEEIAGEIINHRLDGYDYKDMAILCRTNMLTRSFEECFRRMKIPYVLIGTFGFYDRKEVKNALSFMKFLANPEDALAFEEIINTPSRGVGPASVVKILEYSIANDIPFIEVCRKVGDVPGLQSRAKNAVIKFMQIVDSFDKKHPYDSLNTIFEDSGFMNHLRATDKKNNEHREDNILELMRTFKHFCTTKGKPSLAQYLQEIMLLSSADKEADGDMVSLMTIHAAKGLEFGVVFVPGMEEDTFPHRRSIEEGSVEEERRVCYVAVTRAKNHLHLTRSKTRNTGGSIYTRPSRFTEEMGFKPKPILEDGLKVTRWD